MKKIKSGDIFVFSVGSKYGLIQVIEKSEIAGYHVRVFCDLIDQTNKKTIASIISNGSFYYLKDFYEYDLTNKSECRISYKLSHGIKMPRYMRASERKLSGDLIWYVMDVDEGKVVKEFKCFDEELATLSPVRTWGIEYITLRWNEGFSLDKWNDDLENKWYANYLKHYENKE